MESLDILTNSRKNNENIQALNSRNFKKLNISLSTLNEEYDILQISGMKNIENSELAQHRKSHKLFDFREIICPPEKQQKTMKFIDKIAECNEHEGILQLKNYSMQFQQKNHGKPFIKFLMIYERIQYTYVTYYLQRVENKERYSEQQLIKFLIDIVELQLFLIQHKCYDKILRLKDYVITKSNKVKLFLIPSIKKPQTNKIVIEELKNLHLNVKQQKKKKNIMKRLKKAQKNRKDSFIQTNTLRFRYCSPEVFARFNFSDPISSKKINKEASLMYSLGLMLLDMALFQDLTCCYTKYNLIQEEVDRKVRELEMEGYSKPFVQLFECLMLLKKPEDRATFYQLRAHLENEYKAHDDLRDAYEKYEQDMKEHEGDYLTMHKKAEKQGGQKIRDDDYLNNLNKQVAAILKIAEKCPKKLFNMPGTQSKYHDLEKKQTNPHPENQQKSKRPAVKPIKTEDTEFEFLGKYQGELDDNELPHGAGTFYFLNGEKYEGTWEHGKFHGIGRYYWPNNTKYYGQFHKDQIHGYGVCYYLDGGIYQGYWKNGGTDGQGTYSWNNQARYTGQFSKDTIIGQGLLKMQDGSYYEGNWNDQGFQGIKISQKKFQ